jgi:hypothetical protein
MVREHANAVLVAQDPVLFSARSHVVLQAARYRLPTMYGNTEYVEVGGLMSYGPSIAHQFRDRVSRRSASSAARARSTLAGTIPGTINSPTIESSSQVSDIPHIGG